MMRGEGRAKKLNAASFRALAASGGSYGILALVELHKGETSHEREEDGDLYVSVVTHDHEVPLWCLLGALIGGPNRGVWHLPDIGVEVWIGFPGGDYEASPVILACLPSGGVPGDMAPGRVLVMGAEVWIYDGTGTPEPVIRRTEFLAHDHPAGMGPTAKPTDQTITGTPVLKA